MESPIAGFKLATVCAGIKKENRRDLVLMEIEPGSSVAAVFTQNRFCAAPVALAKKHLQATTPKYLLVNTGIANAGTGALGAERAMATCQMVADAAGCDVQEVLPFSTGVISEVFALEPFAQGIPAALPQLSVLGWQAAAEGIMTTDTRPKLACEQVQVNGRTVSITGMSKGAGMIEPNMATMLAFIATDADIPQPLLNKWVQQLTDVSFNRITVDGDTSTNDACVLVATGASGVTIEPKHTAFYHALEAVFVRLAQAIVRDGEGATKFVTIDVEGAASDADAHVIAKSVANSPLVKTALFASDPNWGRILAAVGKAPVAALDVSKINMWLGNVQLLDVGGVAPSYTEAAGASAVADNEVNIRIDLGAGDGQSTVWTCDFSYDYVKINAEYRS